MNNFKLLGIILVVFVWPFTVQADEDSPQTMIKAVVKDFQAALQSGNQEKALSHLADNVLIAEGGEVERSAQEYAGHHLAADIAFLATMTVTLLEQHIWLSEDQAVVSSITRTKGTFRDRPYDRKGTETLVLKKIDKQWKIVYIHWS